MLERLRNVFSLLGRKGVEDAIKELQRALILADVDIKMVKELTDSLRKDIQEELKKHPGIPPTEIAKYAIYNHIINLLDVGRPLKISPQTIMLVGINGSGKTTTAVKLAFWFKNRGIKSYVMSLDTERPAAKEQLKQLAEKGGIEYTEEVRNDGVTIIDTPGRTAADEKLLEELRHLKMDIMPDRTFLVIPADMGRLAGEEARKFQDSIGIDGIIITKMDGSAKGGGALVASKEANIPVYFIGTGEKLQDFEPFDVEKYVKRLLGVPDIKTIQEMVPQETKIPERFDINTFHEQLMQMRGAGPLNKILSALGMNVPVDVLEGMEEKMKRYDAIYKSMTKEERANPDIINESRIRRIARGSGTSEADVRQFLRDYKRAEKLFKRLKKGKIRGLPRL